MVDEQQLALIRVEATPRPTEVEVLGPEPLVADMPPAAQAFANMIARAVVAQQEAPKLSEHEKLVAWTAAFEEWLAENPKTGAPRPANTREAYATAWEDFRRFCPKMPWAVDGVDVRDWVKDLRSRPLAAHVAKGLERNGRRVEGQIGLSDATVNQYLSAVSAFYTFCENYEVRVSGRGGDGRKVALFDGVNPAKARGVKRPKVKPFEKSVWLDADQVRQLLGAVRAYAEVNPAKSLRDYALIVCYLSTGARNDEVRTWQWKDLVRQGGTMFYRWANKGDEGLDELPEKAWRAVEEYLRLTGRLKGMGPEDFIFVPHSDSALRLKRADGSPIVDQWDRNRPISQQEANRCLRQYAKRAGLEAERLHIHALRHTASQLYKIGGTPLEERSRMLHHKSFETTRIYDHKVSGQLKVGWQNVASLLGL